MIFVSGVSSFRHGTIIEASETLYRNRILCEGRFLDIVSVNYLVTFFSRS